MIIIGLTRLGLLYIKPLSIRLMDSNLGSNLERTTKTAKNPQKIKSNQILNESISEGGGAKPQKKNNQPNQFFMNGEWPELAL